MKYLRLINESRKFKKYIIIKAVNSTFYLCIVESFTETHLMIRILYSQSKNTIHPQGIEDFKKRVNGSKVIELNYYIDKDLNIVYETDNFDDCYDKLTDISIANKYNL